MWCCQYQRVCRSYCHWDYAVRLGHVKWSRWRQPASQPAMQSKIRKDYNEDFLNLLMSKISITQVGFIGKSLEYIHPSMLLHALQPLPMQIDIIQHNVMVLSGLLSHSSVVWSSGTYTYGYWLAIYIKNLPSLVKKHAGIHSNKTCIRAWHSQSVRQIYPY